MTPPVTGDGLPLWCAGRLPPLDRYVDLPMSEHVVPPARRETRCEWPEPDVWLIGHQSREGT